MTRISDVIDCWFESGSMPYAQLHYSFENKEKLEANFPAQFIAEGSDQTRAWFYYLHVISGGIKDSHAFQHVIVNGIVLAEDGKKMSKKLQNYPDPSLVMEKYGADALRAYLLSSPVMQAENLNFSESGAQESLRKNAMTLWNVYRFYETYAPEYDGREVVSENVLDAWILAKLKLLLIEVTGAMEKYNLPKAMRPITEFIDELSTWYLRRSRERFKSDDEKDKQEALAMSRFVLLELAKIMAPFMPFTAERLWQEVSGNKFNNRDESVHLQNWSDLGAPTKTEQEVLGQMESLRKGVEVALAARDLASIKIRQMLCSAEFKGGNKLSDGYFSLLADELNVREIIWQGGEGNISVNLDTVITLELQLEGNKREVIRTVNALRKDAGLSVADDINIYVEVNEEASKWIFAAAEDIKKATIALKLNIGKSNSKSTIKKLKLESGDLSIQVEKV